MKTVIAIVSALLFTIPSAFATAQAPDKIFYEGKMRELYSNPLEDIA